MSGIGGFKFKGYYVEKDTEHDTNSTWALKIHKTRVKAFVEANALAQAGWTFDNLDTGNIEFEGTAGAIQSLDDLGYNLISFFKNGDNAYFAICTFCKWDPSTADLANGIIRLPYNSKFSLTNNYYAIGTKNTLFHVVNNEKMTSAGILSGSYAFKLQCAGLMISESSDHSVDGFSQGFFPNHSSFNVGYAVKLKSIISFNYNNSLNNTNVTVLSCDGWKTKLDFNRSNCFCFNDGIHSTNGSSVETSHSFSSTNLFNVVSFCLPYGASSHPRYINNSNYKLLVSDGILNLNTNPSNKYSISNLSFANVLPPTGQTNGGIGSLNVDLLAIMRDNAANSIARFTTYMDGNYLVVQKVSDNTYSKIDSLVDDYSGFYPTLLLGWNPSNPDITQDSAWTEYDI